MGIKMGKYQQEYYNIADLDTGPMANSKDSGLMYTESLKEDIDLSSVIREGLGFSKNQQTIDRFEAGRCPICDRGLTQDTDKCSEHGDVYETYLRAINGLSDIEEEEYDNISKAVSGSHYNDVVPGYQYMQMMQHMLEDKEGVEAHLLGQVYKYLVRSGKKDDVEQEYRKARWYLNCLVKYKQTGEIDPTGND